MDLETAITEVLNGFKEDLGIGPASQELLKSLKKAVANLTDQQYAEILIWTAETLNALSSFPDKNAVQAISNIALVFAFASLEAKTGTV